MAKHWSEPLDAKRHLDLSATAVGGRRVHADARSRLRGERAYFVRAAGFTFQFASLDHVRDCLARFKEPIHPPSGRAIEAGEHYWQEWYERLPRGLTRNPKRQRIVAALEAALIDFATGNEPRRQS